MIVRIRYWILNCLMLDGSTKDSMHFTSRVDAETYVNTRNRNHLDLLGIKEMKIQERHMLGELEDELL